MNEKEFSLIDIAEAILADDKVTQGEVEYLHKLPATHDFGSDEDIRALFDVVADALRDGVLDPDESENIKWHLSLICDKPYSFPDSKAALHVELAPSASPVVQNVIRLSEIPLGARVAFNYTDSKGNITHREISFRTCESKNGYGYIKGVCMMRNALRTFRTDRMAALCDVETGEMIA